jgi:hypothetical protein
MSILRESILLCRTLAQKKCLTDDERVTYTVLHVYISLQMRMASIVLKKNLLEQGFTDDELEGYAAA